MSATLSSSSTATCFPFCGRLTKVHHHLAGTPRIPGATPRETRTRHARLERSSRRFRPRLLGLGRIWQVELASQLPGFELRTMERPPIHVKRWRSLLPFFEEVDIGKNREALEFVMSVNEGKQRTPTFNMDGRAFHCSQFEPRKLARELGLPDATQAQQPRPKTP